MYVFGGGGLCNCDVYEFVYVCCLCECVFHVCVALLVLLLLCVFVCACHVSVLFVGLLRGCWCSCVLSAFVCVSCLCVLYHVCVF